MARAAARGAGLGGVLLFGKKGGRRWTPGAVLNVIANNRAFGNAPALAQAVAFRFLEFAERRGA